MPFTACATSAIPDTRASDPWVSIGPDGTAYVVAITFNADNNNNGVYAATSTDGGKTRGNLRAIIRDDAPNYQFFSDKESVTADPVIAGVAYVTRDRLQGPTPLSMRFLRCSTYGPRRRRRRVLGG